MRRSRFRARGVLGLVGLAVVVIVACLAYGAYQPTAAQPQAAAPPPTVTVAPVVVKSLHQWQEFTGRLEAVDTVDIHPRVNGYIDRVAFADGAIVHKGDLLFQIDPRPYQADVDRLTAEKQRATSSLVLARADFQRARELQRANAISTQEYD
ncbi:biotin/lipoyl-binding protein [Salinisphaera sp. T31B1]|uniref:efflux RND transporter periplasmic adaptor subunit n=1 Tax=Salinisphaera sp. T31B1 TaxID=727963 RepID=UPI0033417578